MMAETAKNDKIFEVKFFSSSFTLDLMFHNKVPRKTELKIIVLLTGNISLER